MNLFLLDYHNVPLFLEFRFLNMKLVTFFFFFLMCQIVWNGWCIGNSMWAGLWSTTIPKAWNLHLLFHNVSHSCLCSHMLYLDIHGQTVSIYGARPKYCNGRWQICNLAHTFLVCSPISPVIGSLFHVSELDSSHVLEFFRSSLSPCTSLLDSNLQNKIGDYGVGFIYRISSLV